MGCLSIELKNPPTISYLHSFTPACSSPKDSHQRRCSSFHQKGQLQKNRVQIHRETSFIELRFKPIKQDPLIVGTLFAGILIPVGTISVHSPSLHLESSLRHQLLQKGIQLISTKKTEVPEIAMNTFSLTVWDLLITRRISCHLEVSITNGKDNSLIPPKSFSIEHSAYETYAFEKELSFYLRECFDLLAKHVVGRIHTKQTMKSYHLT
jgi:hypothetical protein